MDNIISKSNFKNNNRLTIEPKFLKKFEQNHSEYNDKSNYKQNMDKEALNSFKGIVRLKSSNKKMSPEQKCYISNNIFNFTNYLFNEEEHLYKNQIITLKKSENASPHNNHINSPIESFPFGVDINKDKKSISPEKEKYNNLTKDNLSKSSSINPRRIIRRSHIIKNKVGGTTHKNNYSFFFKLKKKDKFPSKTPYLDKKISNQIYNLKNNNFINANNTIINIKNNTNLNIPNVKLCLSSNLNQNYLNTFHSNQEKNSSMINSDKKSSPDRDNKNHSINNRKNIEEEKETKKFEDKHNKNNIIPAKNENVKNKMSNIVYNILNKPFFCCFKS